MGRTSWVVVCLSGGLALAPVASADEGGTWSAWTASPLAAPEASDPLERAALASCGPDDAGVRDVARTVLARKVGGAPLPDVDGLARLQRAAGEPHPWARAWAIQGKALDAEAVRAGLDAWLPPGAVGARRCGVASRFLADGSRVLVVVTVDALADLAPLPTRARTGQWLSLEARLRSPSPAASVVVLDPGGVPRTVPSWLDGDTLHARFAAPRPGELAVQVLAPTTRGPRPVLEAVVFVDVPPSLASSPAPGEELVAPADDERIAAMVDEARASVGLPPLVRDTRLARLARDHARRMAEARELGHDVGDGDPSARLRAAGLDVASTAENVAHAATVPLAHRALWASPSHRMNLLSREVDRMGVAVVRDADGQAWVTELFAGGMR